MLACACSGRECDWLTHPSDGMRCATTTPQETAPLGWEADGEGEGFICPSCVVIRALRAKGPLGPSAFPHNGSIGV